MLSRLFPGFVPQQKGKIDNLPCSRPVCKGNKHPVGSRGFIVLRPGFFKNNPFSGFLGYHGSRKTGNCYHHDGAGDYPGVKEAEIIPHENGSQGRCRLIDREPVEQIPLAWPV
jgi:hypothetical protein